jgi:VPDSG-CTERM motif
MKTWKKKLLWPLAVVALALATSQPAFADDDDDDDDIVKPPTETVPDGGATAALLVGAFIGVEALRRKLNRS